MTDKTKKPTKQSDADTLAYYRVISDAYKERHRIRTRIFKKVLKHMLKTMREECTIFYLMEEIKESRKASK